MFRTCNIAASHMHTDALMFCFCFKGVRNFQAPSEIGVAVALLLPECAYERAMQPH